MGRSRAFTLIEMVIVTALSSVTISVGVMAYSFVMRETAAVAAQASVNIQIAEAIERMRPTIEDAFSCSPAAIANGQPGLLCTMPDTIISGVYAPWRVDAFGKAKFQAGSKVLFYISDSTGSQLVPGDTLWKATAPAGSVVYTIDTAWSTYYSGAPRVQGIWGFLPVIDGVSKTVTLNFNIDESVMASILQGKRVVNSEGAGIQLVTYYRNNAP